MIMWESYSKNDEHRHAIPSHLLVLKPNTTMVTRGAVNKHHIFNAYIIPHERPFMYAAPDHVGWLAAR